MTVKRLDWCREHNSGMMRITTDYGDRRECIMNYAYRAGIEMAYECEVYRAVVVSWGRTTLDKSSYL